MYAWQAQDTDPASRIAVFIQGKLLSGEDIELYATQSEQGWKEPMCWNAIHDWLSGMLWEEIALANQLCRFLKVHRTELPEELLKFKDYEFTDNSLNAVEEAIWEKETDKRLKRRENTGRKRKFWG